MMTLTVALFCFMLLQSPVTSLKSKKFDKAETDATLTTESESSRHKSKKSHAAAAVQAAPAAAPAATPAAGNTSAGNATNATVDKLSNLIYRELNATLVRDDLNQFASHARKWDYKMVDKQIEDIYTDMTIKDAAQGRESDRKSFLRIFISEFENCDKNADNVLTPEEFNGCMSNDTYLKLITPPTVNYAAFKSYADPKTFNTILFNLIDTFNNNHVNFHEYMQLRLFIFSWKHCSVNGPFLEEINFECAIEIASGFRTLSRNAARKLFNIAIELSSNQSIRNLDFISYVMVAASARLYGKLNGRQDIDLSRNEFNLALDGNSLPMRFNQDVVNSFFKLVVDKDKPHTGVDLSSFVIYDFALRFFDVKNATKKYYLNYTEFNQTLSHFLFPFKMTEELMRIPQVTLSLASYGMYTYMNITNFNTEGDHLIKSFLELEQAPAAAPAATPAAAAGAKPANSSASNSTQYGPFPYNQSATSKWLFQESDTDADSFLNFYDYGTFFQLTYIFTKLDKYNKGRMVAGDLYESLVHYAEFPTMSFLMRERAKRFSLLPADLYVDLASMILIMRLDDIIESEVRKQDKTVVYESELKIMFARVNLQYVPEGTLNTCLRGTDSENVPVYDWECAFVQGIIKTLKFYESSREYMTVKQQNITLTNTVFLNPDPALK